jgi:SAM-dependent methyltransferase
MPFSCRFCGHELSETFADLRLSPPANAYLPLDRLGEPEIFYPLHAYVCAECFLVQLPKVVDPEDIFSDYAYFSSYSDSWLRHAEAYVEQMIDRFGFDQGSQVIEIASNDGYLLQYFKQHGVPVLGVEPAANVAAAAEEAGVPTRVEFFGAETARRMADEGIRADLLLGNNVLAHVPDLNDFVTGMKFVLAADGILTMEFPHLMRLMEENQFDTIYHEHYSYFSFATVRRVFAHHGLELFDVEELPTHGGSLRIYGRHADNATPAVGERVEALLERERLFGLNRLETYRGFGERIRETKRNLLAFLIERCRRGQSIVGYGAPAKGNTLLNYCGIGTDFIEYTVDRSPHKQNACLPGSRIPIYAPERIFETRPEVILILPWNLQDEIVGQLAGAREWGVEFVVAIPEVRVLP